MIQGTLSQNSRRRMEYGEGEECLRREFREELELDIEVKTIFIPQFFQEVHLNA